MRIHPPAPPRSLLREGGVTVRLRKESDFDAIRAGQSDPSIQRWLDDQPIDNDTPAAAIKRAKQQWETGKGTPFVIADSVSGEAIGLINLRFPSDTVALVAYSVFPSARGKGIAPAAVQLIAAWGFNELGLKTLILEADSRNTASIRVAEKAGFHRTTDREELNVGNETVITTVFELVALPVR